VAVASAGQYASLHFIPDNHANNNIPPLSFLQAGCPSCRHQQRQSTEGDYCSVMKHLSKLPTGFLNPDLYKHWQNTDKPRNNDIIQLP